MVKMRPVMTTDITVNGKDASWMTTDITVNGKDASWMTTDIKIILKEKTKLYTMYVKNGFCKVDKTNLNPQCTPIVNSSTLPPMHTHRE